MSNCCNFDMIAKGNPKDIQTLIDWMNADYRYSDGEAKAYLTNWKGEEIPVKHHLGYRIEEACCDYLKERSFILGSCAWSVTACMFYDPNSSTYLNDYYDQKEKRLALSLPETCKELNLEVEIFSREPGCGFAEHYLITNSGEVKIKESTNYHEYILDDYDTYEDFVKENGKKALTKDEFENADDPVLAKCKWINNGYDFNFSI